MNKDQQIQAIEQMMEGLLASEPAYFLVDITIKPVNNIKVFVDADSGVIIEKCVAFNRHLYKEIEESEIYPAGDFSLEVSSPGLEEPLKLHRQYVKNIGRLIEVTPMEGKVLTGLLKEVGEKEITVSEEKGKNKKKEIVEHLIPFDNIKTTKIQIVF
ncbi:MAG: ribosome maturation factor RimP [Chitinophagaceae bacterium]